MMIILLQTLKKYHVQEYEQQKNSILFFGLFEFIFLFVFMIFKIINMFDDGNNNTIWF